MIHFLYWYIWQSWQSQPTRNSIFWNLIIYYVLRWLSSCWLISFYNYFWLGPWYHLPWRLIGIFDGIISRGRSLMVYFLNIKICFRINYYLINVILYLRLNRRSFFNIHRIIFLCFHTQLYPIPLFVFIINIFARIN